MTTDSWQTGHEVHDAPPQRPCHQQPRLHAAESARRRAATGEQLPKYASCKRHPSLRTISLPTSALAITDEASPFALCSTRNRSRTAMHRRGPVAGGQELRDDGAGVRAKDDHAGVLARDLPETALHVTSRRLTTRSLAAPFTCSVAWVGEVVHGDVNQPSINGMQGSGVQIPSAPPPGRRLSPPPTDREGQAHRFGRRPRISESRHRCAAAWFEPDES
jgi:hypothetical protein